MQVVGICSLCGKAGRMNTCSLCGAIVCSDCYYTPKGVCKSCKNKVSRKVI
ncbi:MAG: orotate phosphoribosyltransferase [Methanobacteriaceae archaeon]|nr:orotate phosphoribosyltransferase [Methanobacteriaceae archaeon]MDP3484767.1 orotate phosphoribosyltransferase [Methanobacteriaceae archaeon]PKL69121.1 MAG: orotate phosphoribosyltransferase [Methanobacteriales archaeon HGW-Methanobacteriales-1]